MWNRKQLKEKGKAAFKANYWMCVLVALIVVVILGGTARSAAPAQNAPDRNEGYTQSAMDFSTVTVSTGGGIITVLLNVFVFNVLKVGCDSFFLRNASGQATLDNVLDGFRKDYGKNVLTMFLVGLFTALWALLFVIPGIMKAYSYRLVPYILTDSPELSRKEAMQLSTQLMKGNRLDAFVLDLSFIGWEILNVLTLGILGLFYVNPYVQATKAELYLALRYPQAG